MEQKTPGNGGPDRPARHVGSRKRARAFPKGRQLESEALQQVRELLEGKPRRHDLLIEYLHLIQDRYHYISAQHLRALCEEMRLPQAAAYEVATFYAHFDVVRDGVTGALSADLGAAVLRAMSLDRGRVREGVSHYSWDRTAELFLSFLVPVDWSHQALKPLPV